MLFRAGLFKYLLFFMTTLGEIRKGVHAFWNSDGHALFTGFFQWVWFLLNYVCSEESHLWKKENAITPVCARCGWVSKQEVWLSSWISFQISFSFNKVGSP